MFSTPLWLTALGALVIPLVLHLWSHRPRRVIHVGSLRHFPDSPPPRTRSARLAQPLLLLLRLAALAAIVVALAGPRFAGRPMGLPDRLTLVEPALLDDPVLDSLRQAGAAVRLLSPGLPEKTLSAHGTADPGPAALTWDGLVEADRLVAPGGTIDLYARPRLTALGAERPMLRAAVRWHAPALDRRRAYAVSVVKLEHDSLQAIYATGDPAGVDYRRVRETAGSQRIASGMSPGDTAPRRLRVSLVPHDSALRRRVALAVRAVALELGQRVTSTEADDGAEGEILLSRETAASPGLADSIFNHWPWAEFTPDTADPRWASLSQAEPAQATEAAGERSPRILELLFLAAALLLLERWLATRPTGGAA